jgi:hypothetical protein
MSIDMALHNEVVQPLTVLEWPLAQNQELFDSHLLDQGLKLLSLIRTRSSSNAHSLEDT